MASLIEFLHLLQLQLLLSLGEHAIFLAATTCSFHNSPLNAYYKKKRDQGKHHLTATGAVARKLTTVIYAVLWDSKPFEPKSFC